MFNDQNNPGCKRNTYQAYQYQLEEIAFHYATNVTGDIESKCDKSHNAEGFLFIF